MSSLRIILTRCWTLTTDLSVNIDHRAEESPSAALPVHVQHAEDLVVEITRYPLEMLGRLTCRNLIPRIADVANTLEKTVDPLRRTTTEAVTTRRSQEKGWSDEGYRECHLSGRLAS